MRLGRTADCANLSQLAFKDQFSGINHVTEADTISLPTDRHHLYHNSNLVTIGVGDLSCPPLATPLPRMRVAMHRFANNSIAFRPPSVPSILSTRS
jgi:hypothetical protein